MKAPSLIIILILFVFAKDVWCRQRGLYQKSRYDSKIVGGSNDTVQNFPYLVHLMLEDANQASFQCGGTILSENYILTAGHCVQGVVKATIRAGSTEANSGGEHYESAQIIQHPQFNFTNYDNDVAVIRTTRPINLYRTNTKLVKLTKQECDIRFGTHIKVAGWGVDSENGDASPNLMSVVLQALSNDECAKLGYNVTSCQFCAGVPEGGKGTCQGDSGGPAIVVDSERSKYTPETCSGLTGKQVGIASNGLGCSKPGLPGIYTRVSCARVRSWIKRITGV